MAASRRTSVLSYPLLEDLRPACLRAHLEDYLDLPHRFLRGWLPTIRLVAESDSLLSPDPHRTARELSRGFRRQAGMLSERQSDRRVPLFAAE